MFYLTTHHTPETPCFPGSTTGLLGLELERQMQDVARATPADQPQAPTKLRQHYCRARPADLWTLSVPDDFNVAELAFDRGGNVYTGPIARRYDGHFWVMASMDRLCACGHRRLLELVRARLASEKSST